MTTVTARKDRLRTLDACLGLLESALERGDDVLSSSIASRVMSEAPAIRPGMLITEALDIVFSEQGALLSGPNRTDRSGVLRKSRRRGNTGLHVQDAVGAPRVDHQQPGEVCEFMMSEDEARAITARIKTAIDDLCILLLEAHGRRAWAALGYRSWQRYVRVEFALSRSRSYEILDQARVRQALRAAAGSLDIPPVSARVAASIKPVLLEVTGKIRDRLLAEGGRSQTVVADVLSETRAILLSRSARSAAIQPLNDFSNREQSNNSKVVGSSDGVYALETIVAAIDYLAEMPPPAQLIASFSDEALRRMTNLPSAAERLAQLRAQWQQRLVRSVRTNELGSIA